MRTPTSPRPRLRRLLGGAFVSVVAVTVAGCGSGSSGETSAGSTTSDVGSVKAADGVPQAAFKALADSDAAQRESVQQRAVISTGQVELSSGDVSGARARVDTVLARQHGRIADESTNTDEGGTVTSARLVLRVPSDRFDQTMTDLAGIATLRSSTRKAEDVTTQVLDTGARIKAQRAGVRRLRLLVSRAANLPALLAVERELTARQGELESLLQQRAYLSDQTSLATITVDITRHVAPSPAKRSTGGFLGGLHHGWRALVAVVVGLLVAVGAALPFAVAAALVGVPAWLVVRRSRRPQEPEAPAET
jgi:Domain of unknown function (DUF4349)